MQQMALPSATRTRLKIEGLSTIEDFADFKKEQTKVLESITKEEINSMRLNSKPLRSSNNIINVK